MVASIREDVAARQLPGQGEQRRVVGHVARGEHQPSLQQHHNINTINTLTSYLRATQYRTQFLSRCTQIFEEIPKQSKQAYCTFEQDAH